MRSFTACHIPDWQSRVQIGFDQISPSASSTRELGMRLPIFEAQQIHVYTKSVHNPPHWQNHWLLFPGTHVPSLFIWLFSEVLLHKVNLILNRFYVLQFYCLEQNKKNKIM